MFTNRSAKHAAPPRAAGGRGNPTLLLLFTLLALGCAEAGAQDVAQQAQQSRDSGPPPLRYLPSAVRARREGARDLKARARLSMEIAEERLALAAQHADADRFEAATGEIGVYEAVVEDAIRTLHTSGRANNKLRDVCKRVEITLRSHVTRLESIRRALPERHAVFLKDSIEFVRDRRDQALAAFYSDTVLREPRLPESATPEGERATSAGPAQPAAEKKPQERR